jgi:hypothetical protein
MLWILGVVLVLIGVGLYFGAASQRRKLGLMQATQTSNAADLKSLAQSVAKDIGAGSFAEVAEVKGTIRCDNPLVSELTNTPCIFYNTHVSREYEETYWDTDSKGNRVQRTRRGSDTVSQNTRTCAFDVEDATGRIPVDPTGASITGEKVYDRFEPGEPSNTNISIGRFRLNLSSLTLGAGRRTLGYKYEEWLVPLGRAIYVLGEASDSAGGLVIRKPTKKGTTFIVSTKSEEELTKSAAGTSTGLTVGAAIAAAAGIVIAVLSLLRVI